MLSLQYATTIKCAVALCSYPDVRKEIFCISNSDYGVSKPSYVYDRKSAWNCAVTKKAAMILSNRGLPEKLQKRVFSFLLAIGMRMLTWAVYHEEQFRFSREYSFGFLKSSFLTQHGVLDNRKIAEALIEDDVLSTFQKYRLACFYCLVDYIKILYTKITMADKQDLRCDYTKIIKFWTISLSDYGYPLYPSEHLLETALRCGNKAAVEYCLSGQYNFAQHSSSIVSAAMIPLMRKINRKNDWRDWKIFQDQKYSNVSWVPSVYYIDSLCAVLSKMTEDQLVDFLDEDIFGGRYFKMCMEYDKHSKVLEEFLNWPYQDHFMTMAELAWQFLPNTSYAVLLLKICDKVEPKKVESLKYGEEQTYNYRKLLQQFWYRSSEGFKRFVLNNQEIFYELRKVKVGLQLLDKLLTLKHFTYEDKLNLHLILGRATVTDKENLLPYSELKAICIDLLKQEKWDTLDVLMVNRLSSNDLRDEFKRKFASTKEAHRVCIDFVKNGNFTSAESFLKMFFTFEVDESKRNIIFTENGRVACLDLISFDWTWGEFDKFVCWWLSSEADRKRFKTELVFSPQSVSMCAYFIQHNKLKCIDEFVRLSANDDEEIRMLKKSIAQQKGSEICEYLMMEYENDHFQTKFHRLYCRDIFKIQWEAMEEFLTWCFSTEEEINDFKKNVLLKTSGVAVHFNLILSCLWEEAELFLTWLQLSAEEIKILKKETLLNYDPCIKLISDLLNDSTHCKIFTDLCGGKDEAVELFLRWFLEDEQMVLDFKKEFEDTWRYIFVEVPNQYKDILQYFNSAIEQRMTDLRQENAVVKISEVKISFKISQTNL